MTRSTLTREMTMSKVVKVRTPSMEASAMTSLMAVEKTTPSMAARATTSSSVVREKTRCVDMEVLIS